jgi:hypothetical protein
MALDHRPPLVVLLGVFIVSVTASCAGNAHAALGKVPDTAACPNEMEVVRDTVVVTGADGNRWYLERKRQRCVSSITVEP